MIWNVEIRQVKAAGLSEEICDRVIECGLAALRAAHEERDDKASGFAAARRADAE